MDVFVPSLKAMPVEQVQKENVCFTLYPNEPRCPLTYQEGMSYMKKQEARFNRKYKKARLAGQSRGAFATAQCYSTLYNRAKRSGQKALLETPWCIEREIEKLMEELGHAAIAREIGEEELDETEDTEDVGTAAADQ